MWIHDQHGPSLVNKQSRATCQLQFPIQPKKDGSFQLAGELVTPLKDFLEPPLLLLVVIIVVKGAVTAVKIILLITKVIIICVSKSYQRFIHPSIYFYSIHTNLIYILYTIVKYKQFMGRDMTWTHGPSHAYTVSSY